jgi:DNA-binding transcriptional LysR family regulator
MELRHLQTFQAIVRAGSFLQAFAERLGLLVPEDHPLATAEAITPALLAEHRLLLTEPRCAYREATEKMLVSQGANPYSGIEIGSMGAIRRAVQSGLGVAFVPRLIASPPPKGTMLREVEGVDLTLMIGLVRRANRSAPGRAQESLRALLRSRLSA